MLGVGLVPADDDESTETLVAALSELARLRQRAATGGGELLMPVRLRPVPHGSRGRGDLIAGARQVTVGGGQLFVAGLADLVATREAGGRPQDTTALTDLYGLSTQRPHSRLVTR